MSDDTCPRCERVITNRAEVRDGGCAYCTPASAPLISGRPATPTREERPLKLVRDPSKPLRFRKKPTIVEAIQWVDEESTKAIKEWGGDAIRVSDHPSNMGSLTGLSIHTLEGIMWASPGDYIIKGVAEEFYPCKPDIFEQTYEAVDE